MVRLNLLSVLSIGLPNPFLSPRRCNFFFHSTVLALTLTLVLACGSASVNSEGTDWYDRNPDPSVNLEWEIRGWNVQELSTAFEVDYLSDLERDVILHLNMARTDPAKYARDFVEPRLQYFDGDLYREPGLPALITLEGPSALEDCIEDMRETSSMGVLQPSMGLSLAALDHALDLSETSLTGHVGSDGSLFSQRIERHGEWSGTVGEVISYGPLTGREIVLGLLIDDGVSDDSHRSNVLNPNFTMAGIAVRDHSSYGNVCVIEFAGSFSDYQGGR